MAKKIDFRLYQVLVDLSGAVFWLWDNYYTFLISCGVSPSIKSMYPRGAHNKYDVMRNVLNMIEERQNFDILNNMVSVFFKMKGPVGDHPNPQKCISLLADLRDIVKNDPIEQEIAKRNREKNKHDYIKSIDDAARTKEDLNILHSRLISLTRADANPQQRGFEYERLLFDTLAHFEMEYVPSFRTATEQIDGKFTFEKFDYLIEAKWTKAQVTQDEISIFDGKIRCKAQSTRGFFLSANGFAPNAIARCSGERPRIILMDGYDLCLILEGKISFPDAMQIKTDALTRKGTPLTSLCSMV